MTSYAQAKKDHEYLWSIGPAYDMTGGYVDQDDLTRLLNSPTKVTARGCLVRQIEYWFQVGPDTHDDAGKSRRELHRLIETDLRVREIGNRYYCIDIELHEEEDDE